MRLFRKHSSKEHTIWINHFFFRSLCKKKRNRMCWIYTNTLNIIRTLRRSTNSAPDFRYYYWWRTNYTVGGAIVTVLISWNNMKVTQFYSSFWIKLTSKWCFVDLRTNYMFFYLIIFPPIHLIRSSNMHRFTIKFALKQTRFKIN